LFNELCRYCWICSIFLWGAICFMGKSKAKI